MKIRSETSFPLVLLLATTCTVTACGSSSGGGTGDGAEPVLSDQTGMPMPEESTPEESVLEESVPAETIEPQPDPMTTLFGLVQLEQPTSDFDDGYAAARFARFDEPQPPTALTAGLFPPLGGCTVTRTAPSNGENPPIFADPDGRATVGAGDALVFTGASGTWLTLAREPGSGEIEYINDEALFLPLPEGLTLDVPGDVFPAFPEVPIPSVAPVVRTDDVGEDIAPDDTLLWVGGGDPNVNVRVNLFGIDDANVVTDVDCLVPDDGEFTLPAATRDALDADVTFVGTLTRLGITALRTGNALLVVTHESSL